MQEEDSSLSLDERECLPWLALKHVKGLGCINFKRIIDHLGDPRRVFGASNRDLAQIPGLENQVIKGLLNFSDWDQVKMEMSRLAEAGVKIITYNDENYPPRLRAIPDPPPFLYVKGDLGKEMDRALAVVGSRSASDYGLKLTRRLCHGLSSLGFVLVSGMARGIDGEAHGATLDAGGRTVAVLGSGVDVPYPWEHEEMYEKIIAQGAVLSEHPLGTPPLPQHFPVRNRLISGLSLGVIVVEATEKSGSLITADFAIEQGREVFAVPGQAGSSLSRGTHRLIRQGAKLVEEVSDIIEEIAPQLLGQAQGIEQAPSPSLPPDVKPETKRIFEMIQKSPLQIDDVIQSSGLSPAKVSEVLLDLEIKGYLRQLPGKRFSVN